ncbi:hypothetical protein KKI24_07115 [bacterium]|nr:hypothetical protein [bacterium]
MTSDQIERLINAIENLEDTISRSIQHNSALTGVLTRSEEMRALERERSETIRGTERSNQKVLQILNRTAS